MSEARLGFMDWDYQLRADVFEVEGTPVKQHPVMGGAWIDLSATIGPDQFALIQA